MISNVISNLTGNLIIKSIEHLPVLHIVIPVLAGLFSLIFGNKSLSYYLTIFACILNLVLSLLFFDTPENTLFYQIGNFDYKIGIEHLANINSEKIVMYLSVLMLMFLSRKKSIYRLSENLKSPHLFYFLLIINYAGLLGIVLTNDIFNTYVFIEITSLTSYALSVISKKQNSIIGGINYLIYGSFAATLILFGIGILLFSCHSLSIRFLIENVEIFNQNLPATIGIIFIFLGFIMKIGVMPLGFVVGRVYRFSSSAIVQYLLSTGFLVNFFALSKFYNLIKIPYFFSSIGVLSMLISSYFGIKSKNLRGYLTYLIFVSNGMSLVALEIFCVNGLSHLFVYYIIFDGINKFGLFLIFSILEENLERNPEYKKREIEFWDLIHINDNKLVLIAFLLICISIIGLPITIGFVAKLSLYNVLVVNNNYFLLGVLLAANLASMVYIFKLINYSYLSIGDSNNKKDNEKNNVKVGKSIIEIDYNSMFVLGFTILIMIITCFYA
jgi:multicomponent Na+:H+ antiporter subunit D